MIQRPRQRSPAHERPQPPQQLKIPNSRAKELPRYLKPPRKDPLERNGRFAGTHMSFIRLPAVTTRHALVPDSARPADDIYPLGGRQHRHERVTVLAAEPVVDAGLA